MAETCDYMQADTRKALEAARVEVAQLTAERDVLKAEVARLDALGRDTLAAADFMNAENTLQLAAVEKLETQLRELREAAEAVKNRHELETLVTPEAMHFCAVLAKLSP